MASDSPPLPKVTKVSMKAPPCRCTAAPPDVVGHEVRIRSERHAAGKKQPAASGRHEGAQERSRRPVVAQHAGGPFAGHEQVAVVAEEQLHRIGQPAAGGWNEDVDEGSRHSVEAQHARRATAADVEIPVATEGKPLRQRERRVRGEYAEERTRRAVVAEHAGREEADDVQVSVGTEGQAVRAVQSPAVRRDEVVDERAGRPAEGLTRADAAADVEVAVGAEDHALREGGWRAGERADEGTGRAVVAQDAVRTHAADEKVASGRLRGGEQCGRCKDKKRTDPG